MTEFITRSCKAESRYEVIIKTDSEEHYKATEDFARRLIDHAKPKTNAERIRAMSDEELAKFVAEKIVNLENHKMVEQGHTPTATQLSTLGHTMYCTLMRWLKQPAEGE